MDALDKKILSILQNDCNVSMSVLSERIGLSLSACHRRVKLLEANGTISSYSAQLNRKTLGLGVQVFIEVQLTSPQREDARAFEGAIQKMPEVLECHMISGEFDYLMRVAVCDTEAYGSLYRDRLSQIPSVTKMKTLLSLSSIKEFRGFHLD